jgi:hypothetical protein
MDKSKNSTALQVGQFIHTMVLEPHLFDDRFHIVDVQSRVAKAYKEAKAKIQQDCLNGKRTR